MKKILLSSFVIFSFLAYSFYQKNKETPVLPTTLQETQSNPTPSGSQNLKTYKDGTYQGNVTDAFYGDFQVQAVITNGKISDILFLKYPNDVPNSIAINNISNPILEQEAIQKQSANVDIVSGATQSSEAFIKSLQSALDKAQS